MTVRNKLIYWHILTLGAISAATMFPFMTSYNVGIDDSHWYRAFSHDAITQARAGVFPVYVGLSQFLFTGWASSITFFYNFMAIVDFVTMRAIDTDILINSVMIVFGVLALIVPYCSLRIIAPDRPWLASGLSVLFALCPGCLSPLYEFGYYNTFVGTAFIPAIFACCHLMTTTRSPRVPAIAAGLTSFVFMMHSPSGLLVVTFAVLFLVSSLLVKREARRIIAVNTALFLIIFGLTSCWYVVSVVTTEASRQYSFEVASPSFFVSKSGAYLLYHAVSGAFPGAFLPVDTEGVRENTVQLGYALYAITALLIGRMIWRLGRLARSSVPPESRVLETAPFVVCLLIMVIMEFPIPYVTEHLWLNLPHSFEIVTSVPLRLYRIIAALIIVWAIIDLPRPRPGKRLWRLIRLRTVMGVALVVMIGWSSREAMKFLVEAIKSRAPAYESMPDRNLVPPYIWSSGAEPLDYTNNISGHFDPILLNSLISKDGGRVIADNRESLVAACRHNGEGGTSFAPRILDCVNGHCDKPYVVGELPGYGYWRPAACGPRECRIDATRTEIDEIIGDFSVGPGARAIQVFDVAPAQPGGGLTMGVKLYGSAGDVYSEASVKSAGTYIMPVENAGATTRSYKLFVANTGPGATIANACLLEYDDTMLAIHRLSTVGYHVGIDHARGDELLETQIVERRGFAATVNGRPVAFAPSARHLLTVPLEPGANEVRIWYAGTGALTLSLVVSVASTLLIVGLASCPRRCRRRVAEAFSGWRSRRSYGTTVAAGRAPD